MSYSASKLSHFPQGKKGSVRSIKADAELKRRLIEMGFFEGSEVLVKSRMPFGGPIVVEVGATTLALRKVEADFILVESHESK